MSLQGVIEEMGLGEVIQALSLNRHKGTLRIESDEGISKFFYLSEGEIVLIRTVHSEPVRIGEMLVRTGKLSRDQLNQALLRQQEGGGGRLGDTLAQLGLIQQEEIDNVVKRKFEEEFLDIFLLDRGRFEFVFGLSPESLFSPDEKLERISLNTGSLMLEAMRRVDDWQAKLMDLGSLDEIFVPSEKGKGLAIEDQPFEEVALSPVARRDIWGTIDGKHTVREVLARAQEQGTSRLKTFTFIHAVRKEELIRALKADECLNAAKGAIERKDAQATCKFIRAVMGKGEVELKVVQKYLDFLRKSARPQFAQREARSLASQYLSRGDLDAAISLYRTANELDPRDTEVLDRLFYCLLRRNMIKDAVETGVRFREFLERDTDLPLVVRVAKNLKELAPEDPRVLELSGLLLKRQERVDEAARELEAALKGWPTGPDQAEQRASIMGALIEMNPKRTDLVRARREIVEAAAIARERAARRRALMIAGSAVAALLFVLATISEISARHDLAEVEKLLAGTPDSLQEQRALAVLERVAGTFSTVASSADDRADKLRRRLSEQLIQSRMRGDEAVREKQRREEAERAERLAREKKTLIDDALQRIAAARERGRLEDAAREAIALFDGSKDDDPRVRALTIPVGLTTTPPGARVAQDGKEIAAKTPCTIEVPVRGKSRLRIALAGFTPVDEDVDGNGMFAREYKLVRGPFWRRDLDAPSTGAPVAIGETVFVLDRQGRVYVLEARDGVTRGTFDLKAAGLALPPAPPCAAGEVILVAGADGKVLAVEPSGKVRFSVEAHASVAHRATLTGEGRAVVPAEDKLVIIDLGRGAVQGTCPLPAQPIAPAGTDGERAYVALSDGQIAAVDLVTAKLSWKSAASLEPQGSPEPVPGLDLVVFAGRNGALAALSSKDGRPVYSTPPPPDVDALDVPPAIEESRAILATTNGVVTSFGLFQGKRQWSRRLPAATVATPRRAGKGILIPTKDGELVELFIETGQPRASYALGGAAAARPVVTAGGRVVATIGDAVVGIDRPVEE